MIAIVTGAAGFIGNAVTQLLLAEGHRVHGVDCLTDFYSVEDKRSNLEQFTHDERFTFVDMDLRTGDVQSLVDGVDVVFHLAAQPGVRPSWADGFRRYAEHNILATQRLLEAVQNSHLASFVYASSSSVYGNSSSYPSTENDRPQPNSPYGVTKLAAEHLCALYSANHSIPTVALRYFTVYGPRQRPDMAIRRLIDAGLAGSRFPLFGDGQQVRDFTYVNDVARATVLAGTLDIGPGHVLNVAGGSTTSMIDLIALIGDVIAADISIDHHPPQAGDVLRTGGSLDRTRAILRWTPETDLRTGIEAQVMWQRSRLAGVDIDSDSDSPVRRHADRRR